MVQIGCLGIWRGGVRSAAGKASSLLLLSPPGPVVECPGVLSLLAHMAVFPSKDSKAFDFLQDTRA